MASAGSSGMVAVQEAVRRGLRFNGQRVELYEEPLPPLQDNEVRIRSECTNVSIGTELAYIEKLGREGKPTGLGYSNVGVIEELGARVEGFAAGQRVLTTLPHASAGQIVADAQNLVAVPDGLEPGQASLAMLASVAYHLVQRAAPKMLEPTAVIGQGVVGSLVLQIARLCGVEPLIAIDADAARLAVARQFGAKTVDASREDVVARVKELTGGEGVSLCIEAAGTAKVFDAALKMLRLHGRLVVSSTIFEPVPFPILDAFIEREVTVIGAHQPKCPKSANGYYLWTQPGNRAAALAAMLDGRLKVEHLISHRISPEQAPELYERLRRKDRSIVGVVIDWR